MEEFPLVDKTSMMVSYTGNLNVKIINLVNMLYTGTSFKLS